MIESGIRKSYMRRLDTWTSKISAPASASAKAMACPIPLVPPVTRAVWPSSENNCCIEFMADFAEAC